MSAGVPAGDAAGHPGGAPQRPRPRARAARSARGGGGDSGAGRRPVHDRADQSRVPPRPARADARARRDPHLRRGGDGLPHGPRRRPGVLRRDGGPDVPRQGGGRRPARRRPRGARRPARSHQLQGRGQARPHRARGRPGHVQRHAAGGRGRRGRAGDPQDGRGPARAEPPGRPPARGPEPGAQDARHQGLRLRRLVPRPHLRRRRRPGAGPPRLDPRRGASGSRHGRRSAPSSTWPCC